MPVPAVVAASWSPSPENVPPVICTVALLSVRLSGSDTESAGEMTSDGCYGQATRSAAFVKLGGSSTLAMPMLEVTGVLRLSPPLAMPPGCINVQVLARLGFQPKLVGFS